MQSRAHPRRGQAWGARGLAALWDAFTPFPAHSPRAHQGAHTHLPRLHFVVVVVLEDSFVAQAQPPRYPLLVLGHRKEFGQHGARGRKHTPRDLLVHPSAGKYKPLAGHRAPLSPHVALADMPGQERRSGVGTGDRNVPWAGDPARFPPAARPAAVPSPLGGSRRRLVLCPPEMLGFQRWAPPSPPGPSEMLSI